MHLSLLFVALVPTALACRHPCNNGIFDHRRGHHGSGLQNNIVLGLGGLLNGLNSDGSSEHHSTDIGRDGCPHGWQRFERARGPWCIGTFYNDKRGNNWDEAQLLCQQHRAVLTGIESSAEQNYINNTMGSKWKVTLGAVWLGGKRNPGCVKPAWNPQICSNNNTVFQWTDGFTAGTNNFNWLYGQPDGLISATEGPQSCITMWMTAGVYPWRGYFDDQSCGFRYDPVANIGNFGYACGKQAE